MTWFDRAYVKEKLDTGKYVDCAKKVPDVGAGAEAGAGVAALRPLLPSMRGNSEP